MLLAMLLNLVNELGWAQIKLQYELLYLLPILSLCPPWCFLPSLHQYICSFFMRNLIRLEFLWSNSWSNHSFPGAQAWILNFCNIAETNSAKAGFQKTLDSPPPSLRYPVSYLKFSLLMKLSIYKFRSCLAHLMKPGTLQSKGWAWQLSLNYFTNKLKAKLWA